MWRAITLEYVLNLPRCLLISVRSLPPARVLPTESQAKGLLDTEQGPYIVVAVQECSRMNILLFELKRSLLELVKGMDGQLNMTQAMEDLQTALSKNEVGTGYHGSPACASSPALRGVN